MTNFLNLFRVCYEKLYLYVQNVLYLTAIDIVYIIRCDSVYRLNKNPDIKVTIFTLMLIHQR